MEFDELIRYYEKELRTGELYQDIEKLVDDGIERVHTSGDGERIIERFDDDLESLLPLWEEVWELHNSCEEAMLTDLDRFSDGITSQEEQYIAWRILHLFYTMDALKFGLGTQVKELIERQIDHYEIAPDDITTFITPTTESFRTQYYRDHLDFFQEYHDIEQVPLDSAEAVRLRKEYSRGSDPLFRIRGERFIQSDESIPPSRTMTEQEKQQLADKYGSIVWTADELLIMDNYTEDLYQFNMYGLSDFRVRDAVSEYTGVSVTDTDDLLHAIKPSDPNSELPAECEYLTETERALNDLIAEIGIQFTTATSRFKNE